MEDSITILTVDDTKTNLDIILGILDKYDVIPALNAKNAFEIISNEKIDLILLDIMMPEMDGFEMCNILKQNKQTKDIPVIFLTAKSDDDSIQKAYQIGGVDYIVKPFRPVELIAKVNNQINLQKHKIEEIKHNKLIALTELLNNIAHQWRQPLSTISTSASGLKMQHELNMLNDNMFDKCLESILKECAYLSNVIESFKELVDNSDETSLFDLQKLFEHNKNIIFGGLYNCGINPIINIEEGIDINGSQAQLMQAIMHIITNSKDVLCENKIKDKLISIEAKKENKNIIIDIIDNGGGFKNGIEKSIFEPYFTTKHQSQGKGLGLYTVHKIVTEHFNGNVKAVNYSYEYNNTNQKGAKITVILPMNT